MQHNHHARGIIVTTKLGVNVKEVPIRCLDTFAHVPKDFFFAIGLVTRLSNPFQDTLGRLNGLITWYVGGRSVAEEKTSNGLYVAIGNERIKRVGRKRRRNFMSHLLEWSGR